VTAAGGILMVAGALALLFGAMGMTGDRLDIDPPFMESGTAGRVAAFALVVQGALSLLAGWLVLRLRPAGRILGIVLAALGILSGLAQLSATGSSGFLTLVLDAYILYALLAFGSAFKQRAPAR
jgi:hypothetical protein